MEYAVYPFDYMRITQRHDEGNHLAHWNPFKDYADKPIDEGVKDGGRQYFIPQNDYIIDEIIESSFSLRLTTLNKVITPFKDEPDFLHITLTHIEKEDLKKLKEGQIIHKNEKIILEGKGGASANHFHCTYNFGKYYGIRKNSNGKYCFVYDKSLLPTEAYFIDSSFTTILNSRNYEFKEIPVLYKKGDTGENISKIDYFLAQYVYGNYYGEYTESNVKTFQKENNLEITGIIDEITLNKMKEKGLKL